jgi:tRNA(adenine34) deaminase
MNLYNSEKENFNIETIFLDHAMNIAQEGALLSLVPIAALLVYNNTIISHAINLNESPIAHAELLCIMEANNNKFEHFNNSVLYVTLEPCIMCFGAAILAGIPQIIYSTPCEKWGYSKNIVFDMTSLYKNREPLIKKIDYKSDEYSQLLKDFFRKKR